MRSNNRQVRFDYDLNTRTHIMFTCDAIYVDILVALLLKYFVTLPPWTPQHTHALWPPHPLLLNHCCTALLSFRIGVSSYPNSMKWDTQILPVTCLKSRKKRSVEIRRFHNRLRTLQKVHTTDHLRQCRLQTTQWSWEELKKGALACSALKQCFAYTRIERFDC